MNWNTENKVVYDIVPLIKFVNVDGMEAVQLLCQGLKQKLNLEAWRTVKANQFEKNPDLDIVKSFPNFIESVKEIDLTNYGFGCISTLPQRVIDTVSVVKLTFMNDEDCSLLRSISCLKHLDLRGIKITDAHYALLPGSLETISLAFTGLISTECKTFIQRSKHTLKAIDTFIEDASFFDILHGFKHLNSMEISINPKNTSETDILTKFIGFMKEFTGTFKKLDFELSNPLIIHYLSSEFKCVEHLTLRINDSVDFQLLCKQLMRLPDLRSFTLLNCSKIYNFVKDFKETLFGYLFGKSQLVYAIFDSEQLIETMRIKVNEAIGEVNAVYKLSQCTGNQMPEFY